MCQPVGQDCRKHFPVDRIKLAKNILRPGCQLFFARPAFKIFRSHEVPATDVQDLPDRLVHSARCHREAKTPTVGL